MSRRTAEVLTGRVLAAVAGAGGGLYSEQAGWNVLSAAFVVGLFALVLWDITRDIARPRRRRSRDQRPRLRSTTSYVPIGAVFGLFVGSIGEKDAVPPDPLVWVAVCLVLILSALFDDWRLLGGQPPQGPWR